MLQARLLDAASAVVDAVPRGGQVRFIRRPDVDEEALQPLLENVVVHPRPAELEDAFMLMLHQHAEAVGGQSSSEEPPAAGTDRTLQGRRNSEPTAPVEDHAEPVIVVSDLVRRFGDFTAVASTSFEVRRGEIFGLLGPNGAGKTTTFRMLCGLLPATSDIHTVKEA